MPRMSFGPTPQKLTTEERFTWDTCPICQAPHGHYCIPQEIGPHVGTRGYGDREGRISAHLKRLDNVPCWVKLVGCGEPEAAA